jgi:hypothetical protein
MSPYSDPIISIDTQGNMVAEDVYCSADNSRYFLTFMGGWANSPAEASAFSTARRTNCWT